MRKLLSMLALALLVVLLVQAGRVLPVDTRPLVSEKYAGWSGVLRLWVFEGWESGAGSLSPWLNRCVSGFEKRHSGVYVQPQYVDAGAIATMNDSGISSPDMLLFPPGLLESPEGLAPLSPPDGVRAALSRSGTWNAVTYAVPVALGGYLWAWNPELADGIPDTWRNAEATLAVPVPETWRRWDGALLALCSARYSETSPESDSDNADSLPGFDLGLALPDVIPQADAPKPTASATLCCQLPPDFQFEADAWRLFVNGDVAALPVTQREVLRLQTLSEQGRGPDWRLSQGGGAFTDQLISLAITDNADDEKRALCAEFLAWLLSEACQGDLSRAGAFSVTDAPSGYAATDPLSEMEASLRSETLVVPNSFDGQWKQALDKIVREFIEDRSEAPELWRRFRENLANNPNINSLSS